MRPSDISIASKIVAAFALVIICTVGLGGFALRRVDAINNAAAQVSEQALPSTRLLGDLAFNTIRLRQIEATLALAPPEAKAAEAKTLQGLHAKVDDIFATYGPMASRDSAEEAQLLQRMTVLWAQYIALDGTFIDISAGQDATAGPALYRGEMRTVFNTFQDVLKAAVALNIDHARAAADAALVLGDGARTWIRGGLCLALALAAVSGLFLIRRISTPIGAMTAAMKRLAAGDDATDIPALGQKDEVGQMAEAVQVFKQAAIEKARLEKEASEARQAAEGHRAREDAQKAALHAELARVVNGLATGLGRLSAGDLAFRLNESFGSDYEALRRDFNGAVATLQDVMKVVASSALAIRSGSTGISAASEDLSHRTEQQAASLEETAAALDEITATVRKTSEGALHARTVVATAKSDAEQSGEVVRHAVEAMGAIEASSRQIGQIIGVIDEIAFQTNLLALNAGVEAARAGDAGRGFAVVASEVRALAQRSAEAAKEIKTLIAASSQQVSDGVQLVGETGKALERIVSRVNEINTVVTSIAASTQEQATALHQVNTAVNQMDQVTQQNASMVGESNAACQTLSQETAELARLIGRFEIGQKTGADGFEANGPAIRAGRAGSPVPALKTTGRGGAARKQDLVADEDNWSEF